MQLAGSSALETSSHSKPEMAAAAPPEAVAHEGVDGGEMEVDANSGEEKGKEEGGGDEGDKIISSSGNRWPRQETLALLKIRSDMDAVFRDSSLKGPLWEEVARKLAELGYHRSAKKCKEKFENVYKYHKRTKESRSGKSEGKTYRFFDELQALENQLTLSYPPKPHPVLATTTTTTNTVTLPTKPSDSSTDISYVTTTFPSTNPTIISPPPPTNSAAATITTSNPRNIPSPQGNANNNNVPYSLPNKNIFSSTSTSSSTASDENLEERYRKKRKWKEYFRRLTRKVLAKQEEMQKKFLEAVDKRERERVAQQDAWRMQEMARINREHEILVQERQTAAAKDAAVIAFLQKLSGQQNPTSTQPLQQLVIPQPAVPPPPPPPPPPPQVSKAHTQIRTQTQALPIVPDNNFEIQRMNNGHSAAAATTPMSSSSRWPKAEVHALICLRTSLEAKYQENGPKAPLWEEISALMQREGYNRSAKRCKEKWENINKYFKKVKESKKQRREDSKTCPYYQVLDALYKEKSINQNPFGTSFQNVKPNEMMEPLMVQPEQQWRPPPQYHEHQHLEEGTAKEDNASQHQEKEEEEEEDEEDDDIEEDGDSVEDEGGNRYEIVANKLSSVDTTTVE